MGTYGSVVGERMLAAILVLEEAVRLVQVIWEVRYRPAVVLGEAEIDLSAVTNTSE